MTTKKLKLTEVPPKDAVIAVPDKLPLYNGKESENLLCGGCSAVLIEGISEQSMLSRFIMPGQLYIKCPLCGKHSHVAVQVFKGR